MTYYYLCTHKFNDVCLLRIKMKAKVFFGWGCSCIKEF